MQPTTASSIFHLPTTAIPLQSLDYTYYLHCHLEGEVIVASYQLNKQGNDFNYHSALPVIFLLIWCAEVTFALPLF